MFTAPPREDENMRVLRQQLEAIRANVVGVGVNDPVGMEDAQHIDGTSRSCFVQTVKDDAVR